MNYNIVIYLIVTSIAVLIFILLRLLIIKYFNVQKKKYKSNRYPIVFGLSLLIIPFAFFSVANIIVGVLVNLINSIFGTQIINLTPENNSFLIWYFIFSISVCCILIFYMFIIRDKPKSNSTEEKDKKIKTKNIYQAGITKCNFKELPDEEFYTEYVKSLYGSVKINKINDSSFFAHVKEGLSKFLLIAVINDNPQLDNLNSEFQSLYREIKKATVSRKKKKEYYEVRKVLFTRANASLKLKDIAIVHREEIKYDYDKFDSYIQEQFEEFTKDKIQYSNSNDFSLKDIFIHPKAELNRDSDVDAINFIDNWIADDDSSDQIIVSGEYGLGKTTLLKYYSYKLSSKIIAGAKDVRIPIYIELSNEFPYRKGIDSVIFKFLKENNINIKESLLAHMIASGSFLFLLDGFDEIGYLGSNEERYSNLLAIWDLATGKNKIILSGRLSYFLSIDQETNVLKNKSLTSIPNKYLNNELINLLFFKDKEIKAFLRHKFKNKSLTAKSFDFIKNNPALYDMCSRPYLLHITSELMKELTNNPKIDTLNAYQLIEMYVNKWIGRQKEKEIQSNFLNNKDKINFVHSFFMKIADFLYSSDRSYKEIEMDLASKILDKLLEESKIEFIEGTTKEGIESEIFSSYFIERRDNQFSFVHKSIFEFFVAKAILELIGKNKKDVALFNKNWTNEILGLVYEGYDNQFGYISDENKLVPLLLSKISSKSELIHSLVSFVSKAYIFIRDIRYYTIFRNVILFLIFIICLFSDSKALILASTGLVGFISALVRDPVDKIVNIQSSYSRAETTQLFACVIYTAWFIFNPISFNPFINFFLEVVVVATSFVLFVIISKFILSFLNRRILKSNLIQSILKSYYAQIAKEKLPAKYFTQILSFLNFVDSRPIIVEKKTLEAEYCKLPFQNIHFKNSKIIANRLYNHNCYYDIVDIEGISFREIHFNNCKLHKLNLQKVEKVKMYRKMEQWNLNNLGFTLEKISLTNILPGDIDEYSFRSLKRYLSANKLDLRAIKIEDWMKKKFE